MNLDIIIEELKLGKTSELRALSNHIWKNIETVDPITWEMFKVAAMEAYNLTDQEFLEQFRQPMFYRDGNYIDDFHPLMNRENIRGFLGRYVHHLTNTESPPVFHFATALTIMGTACRRNIWIDQKIFKIWPAIQTLILGPSGKMGKTTCTTYGLKMGLEAGVVDRIADEITPEALKSELSARTKEHGEAVGLLYSSELSLLFAKSETYNQGLIQTMTDLFDSLDSSKKQTKTAGTFELKNIAVSFLSCSNEGWATMAIPEHAIGGGLIGRTLVFYQRDSSKEVPFPEFPDPVERQELIKMLQMIPTIKGEFTYSPKAKEWYRNRYHAIKTNWPEDERMEPFWSRYGVHLLRIAMLMRVNEMISTAVADGKALIGMPRVIEEHHFRQADAVLLWCFQYLPRVYSFLGISGHGEEMQKILRYINRQGGDVAHGPLARAMSKSMSGRQLREHVHTMEESGMISSHDLPKPHVDGNKGYKLLRKLEEM